MALLHATVHRAAAAGIRVLALHVHHGLQPAADAWERRVRDTCRRWAARGWPLTLAVHRIEGSPPPGDSIEAWAREVRYAALARLAQAHGCSVVLLAHHRRDQAETVLLQALRGAGPAGTAAMPRWRSWRGADTEGWGGVHFARPWLDQPRERIEAYARRHHLRWVDDPSNDDPRFDRNRLRLAVWPALVDAFPDAEASLARAARRQREAADVLAEVAASDLATCRAAGPASASGLAVTPWSALSPGRRAGVLRAWLNAVGLPADGLLVDRLLGELPIARGGAGWPVPGSPARALRLHRGVLVVVAASQAAAGDRGQEPQQRSVACLRLDRPGVHAIPGGGCLRVTAAVAGGVPWALLAAVTVTPRIGGERFQAGPGRPQRSLKKQYQAAGVPAWARGAPLLWSGDRLLYVPGLGVDARCLAAAGESQAVLDWLP